uniref:Fe2OG dioxygenase domain-containing protein n=1 Tax=Physcomitrium patens TaxID=3218 RepID=A0A7I4E2J6_PHYPA
MSETRPMNPPPHKSIMHETLNHFRHVGLWDPQSGLIRGQSDRYSGLRPEAVKSNLLRGASSDLSEFIWPKDQWPSVPHDDFHFAKNLPTVDLSGLRAGDAELRFNAARLLAKTFSEWGFVQVKNHGVPAEVIERMQNQARRFFNLPLEQKEKGVATRSSKHEQFGYGVESGFYYAGKPWIDRFQCRWSPVCEIREPVEKVFSPSDAEEFSYSIEVYNSQLDKLATKILELCALGLDLPENTFTKPFKGTAGDCIARMNYYPPCPLSSLTLGLGAHTDPNLLTILSQCKVGGLQVRKNDTWISVEPKPDTLIINIGDTFEVSSRIPLKLITDTSLEFSLSLVGLPCWIQTSVFIELSSSDGRLACVTPDHSLDVSGAGR